MGFLTDQEQKRYFYHMALLLLLASTFAIVIWAGNGRQMKHVLLNHDKCVISSLMEQGVDEAVIEEAFVKGAATEEGAAFLGRMGIQEETEIWFLPDLWEVQKETGLWIAGLFLCLWGGLLLLAAFFFSARERIYEKAIRLIDRFMEGDFSGHLPRMEEGGLCRLFEKVDGLANALFAGNEEAVRAKEFLRDTISDISHQLKTPLSALMMYNEIIESEVSADPEDREAVLSFTEKTSIALTRIEELIQALLKVTRLDAGAVVFEKQSWRLRDVVLRAVSELQVRAAEEGKEILFAGDDEVTVDCDLQWTGEAVGNLVKNALDYTDAGGQISVSWECFPGMVRISVKDNGKGIDENDLYHIFKRFYRTSKESGGKQGIGLGLSLAKSIVEGQGGTLSVQSRLGEGTLFTLMLPDCHTRETAKLTEL